MKGFVAGVRTFLGDERGRLAVAVAATVTGLVALSAFGAFESTSAAAGKPGGADPPGQTEYRPGWGCGDKNHTHTGPPGQYGAQPPPGCTPAQNQYPPGQTQYRPGYGCGDKNHTHTGPPGRKQPAPPPPGCS